MLLLSLDVKRWSVMREGPTGDRMLHRY